MRAWAILVLVVMLVPLVHAGDITLSLNQSDYYFPVGTQSIIPLQADNTYNSTINGNLGYTVAQSINQAGMQYQSSNTKSTPFSIKQGDSRIGLSFGTASSPAILSVSMSFSYDDNGTREVDLGNIKIHFVENGSQQKKNQQNQVSSSSQKASAPQQQTNPLSQQEKEMQQMLGQMNGGQQAQQQQQSQQQQQQQLQNSQLNQDSSALKQQMQEQVKNEQQMQKNFQKQIAQDPDFQQAHQQLVSQGYNLTGASLNPTDNNSGSFKLDYQNKAGQQASLSGQMQNGTMQSLHKDTPETRQQMLDLLYNDSRFRKFNQTLLSEGFTSQNATVSFEGNMTTVQVNYARGNETASIRGDIENMTVKDVELLDRDGKPRKSYLWLLLVAAGLAVLGYFSYMRFAKKSEETEEKKIVKKPFDYKKEARAMLEKAGELFSDKRYKDAYMTAGQALRLYLNYENGLEKETTNDEIIEHLRKENKDFRAAKDCFDLCSLVEFAKYKANKKDFDKIVMYAGKVIG